MALDTDAPKGWCLVQRGFVVHKLGSCKTHTSLWYYRQLQSTPRSLEAPAGSNVHPNNSRLPAVLAACPVVAVVHETGPAIFLSNAENQGESTHFSWHGVMEDEDNCPRDRWCCFNGTSGFYLAPFHSQSRLRALLSMASVYGSWAMRGAPRYSIRNG